MAEYVERTGIHYGYGERHISWAAVFGGVFVALACQATLTLLGVGLGFAVLDPSQGVRGLTGIGIGTGVWLFISALISFYIGGWVSGRLAGFFRIADSVLHGIVTWSVATVAITFLFTQGVAGLLGGALSGVGQAVGGASQAVGEVASQKADRMDMGDIKVLKNRAEAALKGAAEEAGGNQQARRAEPRKEQMKQQATEAAATASTAMASVSLAAFAGMALEALAAALGGRSAGRRLLHSEGAGAVARR